MTGSAKQSISPRKGRMDCFVAALLAMTWLGLGLSPEPVIIPADRKLARIDVGLPPRQQISQHPPRPAGHGPAERAMAGVQMQIAVTGGADDRRAVGRHRTQATPERRLLEIAAAREQIAQRMIERRTACRVKLVGIARYLSGAADADAVTEPRDRDFVAFVHHRRHRRTIRM